jgi:hypothetical protein
MPSPTATTPSTTIQQACSPSPCVGYGTDWVAQSPTLISTATGSFPVVTGLTTETDECVAQSTSNCEVQDIGNGQKGYYSLQINSNNNFPVDSPYSNNAEVTGWEQFIYTGNPSGASTWIEYWLFNYNTVNCPSSSTGCCDKIPVPPNGNSWFASDGDCVNNPPTESSSVPYVPPASLSGLTLQAVANVLSDSGTYVDEALVYVSGILYDFSYPANILNLYQSWYDSEFNVFGYTDGSRAEFNSGTTITVSDILEGQSGNVITGTACSPSPNAGTTGETNNLTLGSTSLNQETCSVNSSNGQIVFPESNAPFDVSLSNSGGITATQGSSGGTTITVTWASGIPSSITLSCGVLPAGAQCIFSPSTIPTFSSALIITTPTLYSGLTITTSSSTPTGSTTVTVANSTVGSIATTSFMLTVNAAPALTLNVQSNPVGVSIGYQGTSTGSQTTNFELTSSSSSFYETLIAPQSFGAASFLYWIVNGVQQGAEDYDVYVALDSSQPVVTASAVYSGAQYEVFVQSLPSQLVSVTFSCSVSCYNGASSGSSSTNFVLQSGSPFTVTLTAAGSSGGQSFAYWQVQGQNAGGNPLPNLNVPYNGNPGPVAVAIYASTGYTTTYTTAWATLTVLSATYQFFSTTVTTVTTESFTFTQTSTSTIYSTTTATAGLGIIPGPWQISPIDFASVATPVLLLLAMFGRVPLGLLRRLSQRRKTTSKRTGPIGYPRALRAVRRNAIVILTLSLAVAGAFSCLPGQYSVLKPVAAQNYILVTDSPAVTTWQFFMSGGIGDQYFGSLIGVTSGQQYELIGSCGISSGSQYAFDHWDVSGSISITNQYSTTTYITPSGSGDIGTVTMYCGQNNFSISASPTDPTPIIAGFEQDYTVTISDIVATSSVGYSYSVSISSVSPLPTGVTWGCVGTPMTVDRDSSATCTLQVSTSTSTPGGSYPLTVTATIESTSTSHSTSVNLNVQALTTVTAILSSTLTTTQAITSSVTQTSYTTSYSVFATTSTTLTSTTVVLTSTTSSAQITFDTNPTTFVGASSVGSISACGGSFTNGQSSTGCGSSFSATANLPSPSSPWEFQLWEWSGGVTCTSNTANPASCSVSSSGSLQADYAAQITFDTNPSNEGSISYLFPSSPGPCSKNAYTNGQTIFDGNLPPEFLLTDMIYVCANVPLGYSFSGWSVSGGLSLSSVSAVSTTVTVTGPGTLTASFIQVPVSAVQGTDDGIYYGSNFGGDFTGWSRLLGATLGGPGAVRCGSSLYLAVQGTDDGIYFGSWNTASSVFSGWSKLPGGTLSGPGLAADSSCNLYLAVRGTDNHIYLNWYTGGAWQGWIATPGATLGSPGVAVYGGQFWVAVQGTDDGIYVGQENLGFTSFSGWSKIAGATLAGPRLTVDSTNNVLYMAVRGTDNHIYYDKNGGSAWSGWGVIPTGATSGSPAIIVSDGLLYVEVQGTDNGIYYASLPVAGGSWSSWSQLPGATKSGPNLS